MTKRYIEPSQQGFLIISENELKEKSSEVTRIKRIRKEKENVA